MVKDSRRNFLNKIVGGGVGLGAISSLSFVLKDRSDGDLSKTVPVINEVDICVLGGSCTGVFAAVQAARSGAKVAIVEKQNAFGGVATNALVNIWHSLDDTENRQQIIAGIKTDSKNQSGFSGNKIKSKSDDKVFCKRKEVTQESKHINKIK